MPKHHQLSLNPVQFRTHLLKAGSQRIPLPLILCDTMGLDESEGAGLNEADVVNVIKGHVEMH